MLDHALHIFLGLVAAATIAAELRYGEAAKGLLEKVEFAAIVLTLIAAVLAVLTLVGHFQHGKEHGHAEVHAAEHRQR